MTFSGDYLPFVDDDPLLGAAQLKFDEQQQLPIEQESNRIPAIQSFYVAAPTNESIDAHRALVAQKLAPTAETTTRAEELLRTTIPWAIAIGSFALGAAWITSQSGPRPTLEPVPATSLLETIQSDG